MSIKHFSANIVLINKVKLYQGVLRKKLIYLMQVVSIVTHESAPPALLAFCSRHATGVVSLMCAGKRTHGVVNVV